MALPAVFRWTNRDRAPGSRLDHSLAVVSRIPSTIVFGAVMVATVATGAILLLGNDEALQRLTSNAVPPVTDLLAALLLLLAATRAPTPQARRGWLTIGLAMLVYGLGDGLYAWFELGLDGAAFPSLADAAYVAYYPITLLGLLAFPVTTARRERLRLMADSAIVVIGGGMLIVQSVLRPTLDGLSADPIATLLGLGYPAGDIVLLFGVGAIAARRPAGIDGRALVALVAGLIAVMLADVGYATIETDGAVMSANMADALYLVSTAVFALAGYLQIRSTPGARDDLEPGTLPRPLLYLPYAALAAGYGTLVLTAGESVTGDIAAMVVGAGVLTVIVLLRQELVLRENSHLLADQARRESEARFRSLARNASDAITLVDANGRITDATDARRVLGLDPSTLVGRSILSLAHAEDVARLREFIGDAAASRPTDDALEWRLWDGDGVWRQVETIAANLIDDPSVGNIVLTTRDVGERKQLEQRIKQAGLQDVLTGLPNRALFLDRVDHALMKGVRQDQAVFVAVVNIDAFHRVNDSLGHAAGDGLLQQIGRRLESYLRAGDTIARLGGDEFAILLEGAASVDDALASVRRAAAVLHEPFDVAGTTIHLTTRIGMAESQSPADGPSSVVRNAVLAMSTAGDAGRGGVALFEPGMRQSVEGRFELESDLRRAIERGELVLQFQPIVDLATGELAAAEALVRWDHPTRGRLAPNAFIPLAEETDLIDAIGAFVLQEACYEVATWARVAQGRVPRVSVNLSPHQLTDAQLPWTIQSALAQAGAVPAWLTLEVTESQLMEHTGATLERLHAIRSLGISISIDDFGTGYSSLAYLQQFPMSHIKIDRSFVTPLQEPDHEPGIVRAVVEIGRALGMSTIAEGIETDAQLRRLRELGCAYGQGFLLGRPMDGDAIRTLVAEPTRMTMPRPNRRPHRRRPVRIST